LLNGQFSSQEEQMNEVHSNSLHNIESSQLFKTSTPLSICKQHKQIAQDESFADFLASRNQEVPPGLKCSNPDTNVEQQHIRPRHNPGTVQDGVSVSYHCGGSDSILYKT
jgi:hypothetical protein